MAAKPDPSYPRQDEILPSDPNTSSSLATLINSRLNSGSSPRSRVSSPRIGPSRFSNSDRGADEDDNDGASFRSFEPLSLGCPWWDPKRRKQRRGKRRTARMWLSRQWRGKKRIRGVVIVVCLLALILLVNWTMLLRIQDQAVPRPKARSSLRKGLKKTGKGNGTPKGIYGRMLALAAHALAEGQNKPEPKDLWLEPFIPASSWKPCADQRNWKPNEGKNGYILITANGGMNQQRVGVCNAVVLARLLNATLVVPKFLYSSVWKDVSQFSDIYQEEHFVNYLSPDIRIVKELPKELQSLDLNAIGSVVTDEDIRKEAKPSFYLKNILPVLLKKGIVHFLGFGNRLAFDPIPFHLQM